METMVGRNRNNLGVMETISTKKAFSYFFKIELKRK